jgi:hypothetical protein
LKLRRRLLKRAARIGRRVARRLMKAQTTEEAELAPAEKAGQYIKVMRAAVGSPRTRRRYARSW